MSILFCVPPVIATGPYAPAAEESGSTAVHMDDAAFEAWATGYVNYTPGSEVNDTFQTPDRATGQAVGNSSNIVSLGREGAITMTFDAPIRDGPGWDFAVFENSFSDTFLELAYVEVRSSNGTKFVRFENDSLTPGPVGGFGSVDPTDIDGFAGKYRQGYGTPFDLEDVGLDNAVYVRIIDIVGDGSDTDTTGDPIYDPYPTKWSAGFDLEAIGVSNGAAYVTGGFSAPEPVSSSGAPPENGEAGIGGGGGGCFLRGAFE